MEINKYNLRIPNIDLKMIGFYKYCCFPQKMKQIQRLSQRSRFYLIKTKQFINENSLNLILETIDFEQIF